MMEDIGRERTGEGGGGLPDSLRSATRCSQRHAEAGSVHTDAPREVCLLELMRWHQSLSAALSHWPFVCTFDTQAADTRSNLLDRWGRRRGWLFGTVPT